MNNNIDALLKEIEQTISKTVTINTCIVFYNQLHDIKRNYPSKYDMAKNFFNSVSVSYDYVIICELCKLFDGRGKRCSIPKILDKCKGVEPKNTKNDEFYLKIKEKLLKIDTSSIKTYRDKYFAHSDKEYFNNVNSLLESHKFDLNEWDQLNKQANEILSELYRKISGENMIFTMDLLSGYDLYHLIK